MRRCHSRMWAVLVGLTLPTAVSAGLTVPGEMLPLPASGGILKPLPFDQFRLLFGKVIESSLPGKTRHAELLALRDTLADDPVNRSGVLLRLGDVTEAEGVLRQVAPDRRDARSSGNLAIAFFLAGDANTAWEYQREVLTQMPPADTPARRAEVLLRDFFRLRYKEERTEGRVFDRVDKLFPKLLPSDQPFAVGPLADLDPVALDEALALTQQLVFWLPGDTRLFWLLGELYNLKGDLAAAQTILDECDYSRRYAAPALRDHLRAIRDARAALAAQEEAASRYAWLPQGPFAATVAALAGSLVVLLVGWQLWMWKQWLVRKLRRDMP